MRCFLCSPEAEYTWYEGENFRAVLGLGPIGEGYTVVATRDHSPSMFDLSGQLVAELADFTAAVRARLEALYGPVLITEHGRVAPCVGPATRRHEPHCLHAHRLVFPGASPLDLRRIAPSLPLRHYPSYAESVRSFDSPGQYLFVEQPDGGCDVASVAGPLPRQFLRAVVAQQRGQPELADWRRNRGEDLIEAARRSLGLVR